MLALRIEESDHAVDIFDTVGNQSQIDYQLRLYRLLMYRDLDSNMGQTNFTLYIRNDLLPLYNSIRYDS